MLLQWCPCRAAPGEMRAVTHYCQMDALPPPFTACRPTVTVAKVCLSYAVISSDDGCEGQRTSDDDSYRMVSLQRKPDVQKARIRRQKWCDEIRDHSDVTACCWAASTGRSGLVLRYTVQRSASAPSGHRLTTALK